MTELCKTVDLVEVEPLLPGGGEKTLAQQLFCRVVGQLEVVHAGVDRGVTALACVHLAHHSEAGVQVSQAARGQGRASRCELQERLALLSSHVHQNVYKAQESRTGTHTIPLFSFKLNLSLS